MTHFSRIHIPILILSDLNGRQINWLSEYTQRYWMKSERKKTLTRSVMCLFFCIWQVELNANYCVLIILWVPLFSKWNDRQSNINLNAVACVNNGEEKKNMKKKKKKSNWFVYWLIFFFSVGMLIYIMFDGWFDGVLLFDCFFVVPHSSTREL